MKSGDDHQQDPGQRRGIAHAEIGEGLLVEVERIEQRRVDRAAGAAADDEGRRERLEGVDRLQTRLKKITGVSSGSVILQNCRSGWRRRCSAAS